MNPTVILALISDLYGQVSALSQENEALRQALQDAAADPAADAATT